MNSQKMTSFGFSLRNIWICSEGLNRYLSKIVDFGNKPFNYRGDIYFEVIDIINIKERLNVY